MFSSNEVSKLDPTIYARAVTLSGAFAKGMIEILTWISAAG